MDVKSCAACGQEKPLTAYTKRSGSSSRRGTCRACLRRRLREAAGALVFRGGTGEAEALSSLINEAVMPLATEPPETKPARKRRRRRRGKAKGPTAPLHGSSAAAAVIDESDMQQSHEQELYEQEPHEQGETPIVLETAGELKPKRKRKRRRRRGSSAARAKLSSAMPADDLSPVRPPDKIIIPFQGRFTYNTRILNDKGTGLIRLRGRRETGKRWSTEIPTEMAVRMVEEGAAGILHPGLIHKLYTKTDFRLLILQRDAYRCHYCGRYGDTIDHVQPKSKGGLSSPGNCVCACGDCNLKKADSLDFVYYDEF